MKQLLVVCIYLLAIGHFVNADVFNMGSGLTSLETVPVGNPGNAGEWSGESYGNAIEWAEVNYGGYGPDRICGKVDYTYRIGKYEVTAGQYCEFLNAVGKTDTYGIYDINMATGWSCCNILRAGSSGNYTYSVASDWANRPVNFISWGNAVRFANWVHNGQLTGLQDLSTTEDGSYYLNGATSIEALQAVTRKTNATWVIPSEDEWYKAAYHKNNGVTGNYWDYPTSSDSAPSNDILLPDGGNNANYFDGDYTIGSPYWRTEVGEFENSDSPYGTFDQAGNIWEWNESIINGTNRGLRGGQCSYGYSLLASYRFSNKSAFDDYHDDGFRIALVPEPGTLSLLSLGIFAALRRKKH